MRRVLTVSVFVLIFCPLMLILASMLVVVPAVTGGESTVVPMTGEVVPIVEGTTAEAPVLQPQAIRKGLSIKQRRAMGLTFRNIRKTMAEMQKAGELEDMDRPAMAAAVMDRIVMENPQAYGDPSLDWDSILNFIERIIPIIMRLIALFSCIDPQVLPDVEIACL